jgi:hypothetical protein
MERHCVEGWEDQLGGACLVVGIRGTVPRDSFNQRSSESTPDLVQVDHQAGGYACLQRSVTGVVLPLRDPAVPARKSLEPLLNGLAVIGTSLVPPRRPRDARLRAFGYTSGEPIDVTLPR